MITSYSYIFCFGMFVQLKKYCAKPKSLVSWYSKNFRLQTRTAFAQAKECSVFLMDEYERNQRKYNSYTFFFLILITPGSTTNSFRSLRPIKNWRLSCVLLVKLALVLITRPFSLKVIAIIVLSSKPNEFFTFFVQSTFSGTNKPKSKAKP